MGKRINWPKSMLLEEEHQCYVVSELPKGWNRSMIDASVYTQRVEQVVYHFRSPWTLVSLSSSTAQQVISAHITPGIVDPPEERSEVTS